MGSGGEGGFATTCLKSCLLISSWTAARVDEGMHAFAPPVHKLCANERCDAHKHHVILDEDVFEGIHLVLRAFDWR